VKLTADDDELMRRIQQQDQQAFATLVEHYLGTLHGFAQRMLGNPTEADDIVQEAFLRVWQKSTQWHRQSAQLSTWLHRIIYNLCIDYYRCQKAEYVDIEALDLSDEHQPAEFRQQADVEVQVKTALQQLPPAQRSAIILCHYQEMSNREAAAILGISVAALESLMARGRRTLRKILQAQAGNLLGEL
jgi:RNA polymerase sigma-70 factor (ECF subfamily)